MSEKQEETKKLLETPQELLQIRYAKGEITKAEYEEKLNSLTKKEVKRPRGLTVIAILWLLGGIANLYLSSQNIILGLEALSYLFLLPEWFQLGIPVELAFSIGIFALGLIQLVTIFGLWTGKSWSCKLALAIPLLNAISWILTVGLYLSAPIEFGFRESINWAPAVSSLFWIFLYWSYLRQPHVKEYLKVKRSEA